MRLCIYSQLFIPNTFSLMHGMTGWRAKRPDFGSKIESINKKQIVMAEVTLTAYNVKTKEKNVPMHNAVISKTARGGYIAKGDDGKGNKMSAILGEAKALQAIKDKVATQDF